jgi:diacylglycerol kinase (ATP)
MERNLLFIINPNSGKKISEKLITIINDEFPKNLKYQIVLWKTIDYFEEIKKLINSQVYTDVIAVGGDGTVNQVASSLVKLNISFGIVPAGSGNGLARSLSLSMDIKKAIQQIVIGKTQLIDYGTINDSPFFCTSGVGFDAHIGKLFALSIKRGFKSYIKITIKQLLKYKAKNYTLTFNGNTIKRKAFLITVANGGQYGNDFYIAPQASLQDNKLHIVIVKPMGVLGAFTLLNNVLKHKAYKSKYVETFTSNKITIKGENLNTIHFDGEPSEIKGDLNFECVNNGLKVIVGESFKPSLIA